MKIQSMRIPAPMFKRLGDHLFPGDGDEHGAVILAGMAETREGVRFLARDLVLARDGVDYVPGTRGYRALTGEFVAAVSDRCSREKLCYFAVHCHGGRDAVEFSEDDRASHRRGYPALLSITHGGPVGALVFAQNAAAGEVWRRESVTTLDKVTIVGPNLQDLFPRLSRSPTADPIYHRQSMLFGERGQDALARAKVGIIGLGGAGSLVNEWMARLGVGHIVAIDFDRLEPTNRPRVVGATRWDAGEPMVHSRFGAVQWLGKRLAKYKVNIARRVARQANPEIRYDAVVGNIADERTALLLADADYLFLCADGMLPRLVFNMLVHQYLIPGVQVGAKVPVDPKTGRVGDPFCVSRRVLPYAGGGCLQCNGTISANQLDKEVVGEQERKNRQYVEDDDVKAPSVITMNALAASQAANDFLFSFQGLLRPNAVEGYLMNFCRERSWGPAELVTVDGCISCSSSAGTSYARGDRAVLPCRKK